MKRVVAASVGLWNVKKECNKHLGVYEVFVVRFGSILNKKFIRSKQ